MRNIVRTFGAVELCLPPSHSPTTTIVVATHLCEHRRLSQSPPTNPLPSLRRRTKSMPSMLQNFPAELLHAVFKNLRPAETEWASGWPMAQEVRESLSACSLVCRSWHPIARDHLFRDVVFSFETDSDSIQNLSPELSEEEDARWVEAPAHRKELCWYRPLKTLRMLSDYLERSPGVRSSIRRLFLVRYPPPNNGGTLHDSWGTIDSPEVFVSLLTKLPLLSCLHTRNISVSVSPVGPLPSRRFCAQVALRLSNVPHQASLFEPGLCRVSEFEINYHIS